jgi:hypothetical protein
MEDVNEGAYHYAYHTIVGRSLEKAAVYDTVPLFDIQRNYRIKIISASNIDFGSYEFLFVKTTL